MLAALKAFQAERIARTYQDWTAKPEFEALGAFFFDQIYAPRDFRLRDTGIRTLHRVLGKALPGPVVEAVGQVIDLHDLTERLDYQMARELLAMGALQPLQWKAYGRAYRKAGSYRERQRQIALLLEATARIHRISQWRTAGWILNTVEAVATVGFMATVMHFLQDGYRAFHRIQRIEPFLETVRHREHALNDFLFRKIPYRELPPPLLAIVSPEAAED